ncbi:hypothetical protein EYC58_03715 [Candidatus Saccharibacteria bacterium]|nr:MAG: hypothetical protein EYC58_03715 [Candidatus Saccharibacteria bacterium]
MSNQEDQPIITGVPEHLRQPQSPSDDVVENMGGTAVTGGRFGRGIIELTQVGPRAIREAAQQGTVEGLGAGMYIIPPEARSGENGDDTPSTSSSEVRKRAVETPVVDSMGNPEYPEDL